MFTRAKISIFTTNRRPLKIKRRFAKIKRRFVRLKRRFVEIKWRFVICVQKYGLMCC